MSVHPGCQAEYERRHSPIWPELEDVLRSHGVREYSIFLDPTTCDLFAYVEIDSQERWDAIAEHRGLPAVVGAYARADAVIRRSFAVGDAAREVFRL